MIQDGLSLVPIDEDVSAYVALELEAAGPLARFVYRDLEVARTVHTELVLLGVGEQAVPYGRLLRDVSGTAVAMYTAPFYRSTLPQVRLLAAQALTRIEAFCADPSFRARMIATRELFFIPIEGDAYLSRIAVNSTLRGKHVGEKVFARFRAECLIAGARRIVLEVSSEHAYAREFYARLGFRELAIKSIEGDELVYVHLALNLD